MRQPLQVRAPRADLEIEIALAIAQCRCPGPGGRCRLCAGGCGRQVQQPHDGQPRQESAVAVRHGMLHVIRLTER